MNSGDEQSDKKVGENMLILSETWQDMNDFEFQCFFSASSPNNIIFFILTIYISHFFLNNKIFVYTMRCIY